ncbi:MAG: tetratricopeptide repeat protein [Usitatibacter sp.]
MGIQRRLAAALAAAFLWAAGTAHAVEDDMAPLRTLAQSEAARGSDGARAMLGLLDGRTDKDQMVKAMGWLQEAADHGRPEAQFQLAFQYETAPAPDFRRAFQLYERAAQQGYPMAQSNLATLYLFGRGVKRDPDRALEWSMKAAEKGNIVSQARLGAMYLAGDGVQQDSLKAEYWLVKAAGQGYAGAQAQLGSMFFRGEGGAAIDPPKGLYWLKRAAEQGQPQARAILAEAVKKGVPGASDPLPDAPAK